MQTSGQSLIGQVDVTSVSGRGFTPEELAEVALSKIIHVGSNSHPLLKEQAEVFKAQIRTVLVRYMRQAVASHNTTLANRFRDAGHPELIKLLEY